MAHADVKSSPIVSSHQNAINKISPMRKRSRLSLQKNQLFLTETYCDGDEDFSMQHSDLKLEPPCEINSSTSKIEIVDLSEMQDENASPNCSPGPELKSNLEASESDEIKEVSALGLPNCGNTCYINSILQVLRYTPNFLSSIHSLLAAKQEITKVFPCKEELKDITFFIRLHFLYVAMKKKEALMLKNMNKNYCVFLLRPVESFILCLREVSPLFEEGEQHDAHELLTTIISTFTATRQMLKNKFLSCESNTLSTEPKALLNLGIEALAVSDATPSPSEKKKRSKVRKTFGRRRKCPKKFSNNSLENINFDNLDLGFEGKIRHVIKCLECEQQLEREEEFANLVVSVPETTSDDEDAVNLQQCLSQTTTLSGENKFFCGECQHLSEAKLSSEIVLPPSILLLHFSWLRNSSEMTNIEKNRMKLFIPLSLETSENVEVFRCIPDQNYRLYAIVLHIGQSTDGGHYVSFIKNVSETILTQDCSPEILKPKVKTTPNHSTSVESCCATEEIINFKSVASSSRWLLFDDETVSSICIDEASDTFPYFDYVGATASPCLIFYHRT